MNILLLAPQPFYQQRGTPIAVKMIVEVLAAIGHQIDIIVYHEGQDVDIANTTIHRIPKIPGVKLIPPGPSWKKLVCDMFFFVKSVHMLRRNKYDLIHAVEESAFMAILLKRLFKIPFVYDMDSSFAQQMVEKYKLLSLLKRNLQIFEKSAVRNSIGVVAVCKFLEDIAHAHDPEKYVLRLEDTSLLGDCLQKGSKIKELLKIDGQLVMYVGNLEKYQGIDLLLDSFQVVAKSNFDAHLVIIGGSESDIQDYERKAMLLGIDTKIHFLGPKPVNQLAFFLKQADILVSPRIMGGNTPMKIYSYMDSGKPIVATRHTTHTQVLDDRIALLASPEPEAVAHGIIKLLNDKNHASDLANRAKEKVQAEYSFDAFQRKLLTFYETLEKKMSVNDSACIGGI